MGRSTPQEENIAMLIRDVQGIRKQFTSSIAVLVTRNQVEFAYKVAMEAICFKTKIAFSVSSGKDRCACSVSSEKDLHYLFRR